MFAMASYYTKSKTTFTDAVKVSNLNTYFGTGANIGTNGIVAADWERAKATDGFIFGLLDGFGTLIGHIEDNSHALTSAETAITAKAAIVASAEP